MLHLHARSKDELYVYNGLESKRILAFLHFRHQKPPAPLKRHHLPAISSILV